MMGYVGRMVLLVDRPDQKFRRVNEVEMEEKNLYLVMGRQIRRYCVGSNDGEQRVEVVLLLSSRT
jgi:hypothetical protein